LNAAAAQPGFNQVAVVPVKIAAGAARALVQGPEQAAKLRQFAVRMRETGAKRLQLFAGVGATFARDFADTPLEPPALRLECERTRIPLGEGVLHPRKRRGVSAQKFFDLLLHRGQDIDYRRRVPALVWAGRPIFPPVGAQPGTRLH